MIKLEDLRFGMEVFFYKGHAVRWIKGFSVNCLMSGKINGIQRHLFGKEWNWGISVEVDIGDEEKDEYFISYENTFLTRKDALLWLANNLETQIRLADEGLKDLISERNKALMEAQQ